MDLRPVFLAMLCVSCGGITATDPVPTPAGSGGSGPVSTTPSGGGGSTDAGLQPDANPRVCPPDFQLTVSDSQRACSTNDDCMLLDLPLSCGRVHAVIGLAKSASCGPRTADCNPAYPTPAVPTYDTDDWRETASISGIRVRCLNGFCRSTGPDCAPGQPCSEGSVCVTGCTDSKGCKKLPPGCVVGSDATCATQLCGYDAGHGDGSWRFGDVFCDDPYRCMT